MVDGIVGVVKEKLKVSEVGGVSGGGKGLGLGDGGGDSIEWYITITCHKLCHILLFTEPVAA